MSWPVGARLDFFPLLWGGWPTEEVGGPRFADCGGEGFLMPVAIRPF